MVEKLSSYPFNVYQIKSNKEIINFLSRINNDDSDPHEMILTSFRKQKVLHIKYYNIQEKDNEKY